MLIDIVLVVSKSKAFRLYIGVDSTVSTSETNLMIGDSIQICTPSI